MGWTVSDERELVLAIVMALRKGMKSVRGLRKQVTEDEEFLIGRRIAQGIRESNYKIERGPPALPHGGSYRAEP